MEEAQLLGYGVLVVITLGSFIAVINKFTQPINDLKVVIQKLNDCIENIKKDNEVQNKRIEKHGFEIDNLKERVNKVETKVNLYHEKE